MSVHGSIKWGGGEPLRNVCRTRKNVTKMHISQFSCEIFMQLFQLPPPLPPPEKNTE